MARCTCAISSDQYHGWECSITDGACVFLIPDSKRCAELYGEGPDAMCNGDNDEEEDYE